MIGKEKKNLLLAIAKILLTVLIFYIIFRHLPLNTLIETLSSVRLKYLAFGFIVGLLFSFLKIFKWHLFLRKIENVPFGNAVDGYFMGMAVGIVTPGRVGELARVGNLGKEKRVSALGLTIWDKIFDLWSVLLLAVPGIWYFLGPYLAILLLAILIGSLFILLNPNLLSFFLKLPFLNKHPEILEGLRVVPKKTFIENLFISFISYFLVIVEAYLLILGFGVDKFKASFLGYPVVMFTNVIPITIAGLGVREGAAIYLLGKFGILKDIAFNTSFLIFLFNTAFPALLGIIAMNKKVFESKFLIYIIMAISGILRFLRIGVRSIWLDEAITVQVAQGSIRDIISNRASTGIHPPLYFSLMHFWMKIFGSSEIAVRSFSAIFGILCVYMIYKLASKCFDKGTGLIASLLFGLSPFYIYYAQEARMYPLVTFLMLLSLYYLSSDIKDNKNLIKLSIVNILALYTHVYTAFLILAENIFVLLTNLRNRKVLKKWIIFQFIILIAFSPWIYVIVKNRTPEVYQGAQRLTLKVLANSFLEVNLGAARSIFLRYNLLYYIGAFLIILFIIGLLPPYENKKGISLILIYLFVPIFTIIIFSLGKSFFSSRYISPFVPGYLMIVARGIKKFKFYPITVILLILLLIMNSFALGFYYKNVSSLNRPWREAVAYLHQNVSDEEKVLILAPYMWRPFEYYNQGKLKTEFVYIFKLDKLLNDLKKEKKFWLILANDDIEDPEGKVIEFFDKNFKKVDGKKFYRLKIYAYEPM